MSPDRLEERMGDDDVRVVDLREAEAYADGHVPAAVHLELARLGTSMEGRDNVVLGPEPFAELMSSLGISNRAAVVAYDDQWGLAAARLVWTLHYHGHPRAAVLDGGWDRWTEEGRPVSSDPVTPPRGSFVSSIDAGVGAEIGWLERELREGRLRLLDTRTTSEFDGGHLPGAASWDWFNAVPPGSWDTTRNVEELRAEWSALGIEPGDEVVVYCRSGMRAAHTWVAMRRAGYDRVRLYDGSWQEWSMTHEGA